MVRVIIRILLTALAIIYLFPLLPGTEFNGNLFSAFIIAAFFCLLLAFLEVLSTLFAGSLTLSSLGNAILVIIPVRILFFWVLPTLSLLLIVHSFPGLITMHNPIYAAVASLTLLAIALLTWDKST
jgi:hypothetical protein